MQIVIQLSVPDPIMAGMQADSIASMIKAGVTDAQGSGHGNTFFSIDTTDDDYEHGDYRDEKGNLVHIVHDHIVTCTWAKEGAPQTEPGVSVYVWEQQYGALTLVEAEDGDDQDGHGHQH